MKAGDRVVWTQRDRVTGQPLRTVATAVRSIENVIRPDGSQHACAVLECERLVPLADLAKDDPQASGGRQSPDETDRGRQSPDLERNSNGETTLETVSRSAPGRVDSGRRGKGSVAAKTGHDRKLESDRNRGIDPATGHGENSNSKRPIDPAGVVSGNRSAAASGPCNVLAVDFLNVLVRAFFAGQRTETHAVRSMFQTVANAIRTIRPAHVVFAMDGGHEKRSRLLPQYKAHRPPAEPELVAQKELGELALQLAGFQFIRIDGWEADDVLASVATAFSDTVILSADKDLLALPSQCCRCRVFHPWKGGQFATAETELEIASHLVTDYLALCGDTSDGIPGVRGIGPKTAVQLLQEYDSLEGILSAATAGQIRGAVGTKLKEQRAIALLCREVVELNCRLPLPELVRWKPAADFQHQLQSKRLGAVAAIVDGLKDQRMARDAGDCSSDPGPAAIIEREPVPDLKPKRKGLFDAD